MSAFDAGSERRRSAVGGLGVADIKVIVSEYGAADRADQDGFILYTQFVDGFGEIFVDDAVSASGAVVCDLGISAFSLKIVVKSIGFFQI